MQTPPQDNPYAATGISHGGVERVGDQPSPAYRLFTPRSVAIGSFLGSCVGGGILMAINYYRLGRSGQATVMVVGSVLLVIVVATALAFAPEQESIPTALVGLMQATLMYVLAQSLQTNLLEDHLARGGAVESSWKAAGIGFLTGVVMAVMLIGGLSLLAWAMGEEIHEYF